MDALLVSFEERLGEVDTYIDFLKTLEAQARMGPPKLHGADHPITASQQRMLYSSVYLQLYNLVESTMTRCLEAVGQAVMDGGKWKAGDLSPSLLEEWVRAVAETDVEMSAENRLSRAMLLSNRLIDFRPIEAFEIDKRSGGNWDDLAIERVSRRLGFELKVSKEVYAAVKQPIRDERGPLAMVKHLRNCLAHGSISFAECADQVTVKELINLKCLTAGYLREVVNCFVWHLSRFEFLRPERRPI